MLQVWRSRRHPIGACLLGLAALGLPGAGPAAAQVPEIEVLSYTKDVPGGSATGDENPFLIDIAAEQDIPPFGTSFASEEGSVELVFRLPSPAEVEVQGELARLIGGAGVAEVTLRLTDVTDPGDPVVLLELDELDIPGSCDQELCFLPLEIGTALAAGDYVLYANAYAAGAHVFIPSLGRIVMGGGYGYVDVSMERVPEPPRLASYVAALAALAGLGRTRSRRHIRPGCYSSST